MVSHKGQIKSVDGKCQTILDSLEEHEKIAAAKSSYQYLKSSISSNQKPSEGERDRYALAMVKRHLIYERGNVDVALKKIKSTIKYREKMMVDIIRLCFSNDIEHIDDEEFKRNCDYHRKGFEKELMCGKVYIRGRCLEGRPLFINLSHLFVSGFDKEWYIKYMIFTLEKAIACIERESNGKEEKVVLVFDMGRFSYKVTPPVSLIFDLIHGLQNHYPERAHKIIMVDASFVFRLFYKIIEPFMNHDTKEMMMFVTGDQEKKEKITKFISDENAMAFMLPGGKVPSEIDMRRYLYEIPFDHHYTDP